jgi:hypothetical protein
MYHEDWLMSQIRLLAAAIARTVFRKDAILYEIQDEAGKSEADELYKRLLQLVESGDINEAEDLLFDALNPDDRTFLLLAVDFYQRLNDMSDADLERCNFSRTEIIDGLSEVQNIYGLNL